MENVGIGNPPVAYDYAVASRPFPGERQSGDAALVDADADNILVAVVDGLGHGAEAAHAASVATRTLQGRTGRPLVQLFELCDAALRPTRGAALAVAALQTSGASLSWSGVGNVEGVLIPSGYGPPRRKQYLINQGGVVGYRMPAVHVRSVPIHPGDVLIFATDGIDERFSESDLPAGTPEQVARAILERHGKNSDDALVLVLCWRGAAAGPLPGEPP